MVHSILQQKVPTNLCLPFLFFVHELDEWVLTYRLRLVSRMPEELFVIFTELLFVLHAALLLQLVVVSLFLHYSDHYHNVAIH